MTAFEILLNKFYDSIESNEPTHAKSNEQNPSELFTAIKEFIDAAFFHGHKLSYRNFISECIKKAESLLRQANHEHWAYTKYIFMQYELNTIRRDRIPQDVQNLKSGLDNTLFV